MLKGTAVHADALPTPSTAMASTKCPPSFQAQPASHTQLPSAPTLQVPRLAPPSWKSTRTAPGAKPMKVTAEPGTCWCGTGAVTVSTRG